MNIKFIGTREIAFSLIIGTFKSKISFKKIVIIKDNQEVANNIHSRLDK